MKKGDSSILLLLAAGVAAAFFWFKRKPAQAGGSYAYNVKTKEMERLPSPGKDEEAEVKF